MSQLGTTVVSVGKELVNTQLHGKRSDWNRKAPELELGTKVSHQITSDTSRELKTRLVKNPRD